MEVNSITEFHKNIFFFKKLIASKSFQDVSNIVRTMYKYYIFLIDISSKFQVISLRM